MKLNYRSKNGRFAVEFEGAGHKDIWAQIGSFQEVFEEPCCGKCQNDDLRFVVRKTTDGKKEYDYHELRCVKCGAKLAFGIMNDGSGSLFPKRKDKDGKAVGTRGWVKWNPETEKEE
jgi:hypothetical protein